MEDSVEPLNARTYACVQHPITILTSEHRPLSYSEKVHPVNNPIVQSSRPSLPKGWSLSQQQWHHLRACWKGRVPGPTSD